MLEKESHQKTNPNMHIRKAEAKDYKTIVSHLLLAMEDIIYQFIQEKSEEKAVQLLEILVQQKGNQYSYENCWVAEVENEHIGTALVYDGAMLHELRTPVAQQINNQFNIDFTAEDETQAGEFYIDCVGISTKHQGKGLGSQLFKFLIEEYVQLNNQILGLLVDKENPNAKKLYLKLGFVEVGTKTLVGKQMEHLQYKSTKNQ